MNLRGKFATEISNNLQERGWSVLRFAKELNTAYEHARKITRGLGFPSKRLLKRISAVLGLNFEQMQQLIAQDKIAVKYGMIHVEQDRRDPKLVHVDRLLSRLTEDQLGIVTSLLEEMDRRNRAAVHRNPRMKRQ